MNPTEETNTRSLEMCNKHHELKNHFCKNCKMIECPDCLLEDHPGHRFCYYDDILHSAITKNKSLDSQTKKAIATLKMGIETINSTSSRIEVKSREVAEEVRSVFRKHINALKERECNLLLEIDEAKQKKVGILLNQVEELSTMISELTKSSELLTEPLDLIKTSEIISTNKKAESHLLQLRSNKKKLIPLENDGMHFIPPDTLLLSSIESAGCINLASLNAVVVKQNDSNTTLTFGCTGNQDGKFYHPWGVCCNSLGQFIVADMCNSRVQVFDSNGNFLYKFGTYGSAPGQFNNLLQITLNPKEHILVADRRNYRIQIFEMDGTFISSFGEKGSENGQFNELWGVACNAKGQIVVGDKGNHCIQLFTPDGVFLSKYIIDENASPAGVCFTQCGDVVVADHENHCLFIVNSNMTKSIKIGALGSGKKQFNRPEGVFCDDEGNIIVSDTGNNRIQVLGSDGNFLWEIGKKGQSVGELHEPCGVCLTPEGRIVVVDQYNNRVQIF